MLHCLHLREPFTNVCLVYSVLPFLVAALNEPYILLSPITRWVSATINVGISPCMTDRRSQGSRRRERWVHFSGLVKGHMVVFGKFWVSSHLHLLAIYGHFGHRTSSVPAYALSCMDDAGVYPTTERCTHIMPSAIT